MDYINLIWREMSLTSIFMSTVWGVLIGIVLSIIVCIVSWQTGVFKRTTWAKWIAGSYYLLIPVLFIYMFVQISFFGGVQNSINTSLDTNKTAIEKESQVYLNEFQVYLTKSFETDVDFKTLSLEAGIESVAEQMTALSHTESKPGIWNSIKEQTVNRFSRHTKKNFIIKVLTKAASSGGKKVSGFNDERMENIIHENVYDIFTGGLFIEMIRDSYNKIFKGIYITYSIILLLLLSVFYIESFIAKKVGY